MEKDEFRLALAYHVMLNRCAADDVALLWEGDKLVQIQRDSKVNPNETSLTLPIVELLRVRGERLTRGFTISTTAEPTEACLGMARMCGIHYILYLKSSKIYKVMCRRDGTISSSSSPSFNGPIWNVSGYQGQKRINVAWYNPPSSYKEHLKNWAKALAGYNTPQGDAADTAETMVLTGAVQVSKFSSSGLEYLGLKALITDDTVRDNVLMMLAFEMVAQVSGYTLNIKGQVSPAPNQRSKAYGGQNIGSLLTDSDGNIVGWGFNTNKQNSTRHGEINLISAFQGSNPGEPLPPDGTIYTTLEPCEMCSGAIARSVKKGNTFRVIYGQKDENVSSTALQRKANAGITMEASKAAMVTAKMIQSGTATGATDKLATEIATAQSKAKIIATTKYLKEESTYTKFFGAARPNWWLYLWDHLTSRLMSRSNAPQKLLEDAEFLRLNTELNVMYTLVEQFLQTVKKQAVVT